MIVLIEARKLPHGNLIRYIVHNALLPMGYVKMGDHVLLYRLNIPNNADFIG